ncbi:YIP1 family protein [Sporosarcina sp. YIM B06819]|uniref:YIP1 family protein n=1 Tax=Sporosarcina sp. YIM B06819 TaxID=3081769 RepID=UPI00298CCFAA|nr:YIP1 family protein [Sporosarcina sp. YIM B06819]
MGRRRRKWQKYIATVTLMTLFLSFSTTVKAESPYDTFSVNGFGQTIFTQPAYEPQGVLADDIYIEDENGESVYSPLNQPKDFFVAQNDEIYIADTGNDRIVHLDMNGELIRVLNVPESPLNKPSGIFITENNEIYIADTGNKRVVLLDNSGAMIKEYLRPESKYIDDSFVYEPTNMIVDNRGFVYVVSRGTFQGIIQFSPEGAFYGFYGTNITEVQLMDRVRNIFYTKEQLARQVRLLPNPITNIAIDDVGYIYTVSSDAAEQIKKLNIRGENQWKDFQYEENINLRFLRRSTNQEEATAGSNNNLTDISIDENGIVTVVDKSSSIIAQFDQNGEILFYWGAPVTSGSAQKGVPRSPVAVETNSRKQILVLDDSLNLIQVLQPTEFGETVQMAFVLTEQGDYDGSEKYWKEVARQNALFTPAYNGLARSAFYKEDYAGARELYKRAGDAEGYSDSFWQIRLNWFQSKFPLFANAFLIFGSIALIWIKIQERKRKKKGNNETSKAKMKLVDKPIEPTLFAQLKHAFYTLRHPIDGFDDIRFRNMGSYLSAIIVLVAVVVIAFSRTFLTSFTFFPVPEGAFSVGSTLAMSVAIWVSWVVCQYLIGAIKQGQARFKDIFVGSAYSLFPIAILGLPLAFLSNIMTWSEISIYNAATAFMTLWCAALFFWMIMTLQNYSVGETIISILLTLFSMIILWVLIFIIVGLTSETVDFIITLYKELTM